MNPKLLEIIGAILVLSAWFFEWSSLKKWDDVQKSFESQFTQINSVLEQTNLKNIVRLEAAVDRAVRDTKLDDSDPISAPEAAWRNAGVRMAWTQGALRMLKLYSVFAQALRETTARNKLKVATNIDALDRNLNSIWVDVLNALDDRSREAVASDPNHGMVVGGGFVLTGENRTLLVDASRMTFIQSADIDYRVREFQLALHTPIGEINSAIEAQSDRQTLLHRVIFGFGSVIYLVSTILTLRKESLEKRVERRSESETPNKSLHRTRQKTPRR